MMTDMTHNVPCSPSSEDYETYHRVAKVIGEVVSQSFVDLLKQLSNPCILDSLDVSEPEIAAFFKLLSSTKITVEFTNPVEAQLVEHFHSLLNPKLLNSMGAPLQLNPIEVLGEVRL